MPVESDARSPELTPEVKGQLVTKLGSLLHEEWRAPRKQADGTFEPRVKGTKDETWKAAQGKTEVDIANTSFADLPADWQGENLAAAEVAMNEVFSAVENGGLLNAAFVEKASAAVHNKWLKRNGAWAPAEQKKPFGELAEDEKEKDRAQVRKAIEIYEAA